MLRLNQPPKVKKIQDDFDYEKQSFEEFGINPYEIVVAVAKTARDINDRAQKFLGPEYEIRPTNLALKKLNNDDVEFIYEEEKTEPLENPAQKK